MRLRGGLRLIAFALGLGALLCLTDAHAKPRAKPAPKAKPTAEAAPASPPAEAAKPATPEPDTSVKAAGTKPAAKDAKDAKDTQVTSVEESAKDKGVKTYKFSAVEIEGRLKSPQIIYFLRRVRAEFEAGDLGHRSFVPELSDTRRSPSLR